VTELFFPVPAIAVLPRVLPHHAAADTGEGQDVSRDPAGQVDPGEKWIKSEPTSIRNIITSKLYFQAVNQQSSRRLVSDFPSVAGFLS
jgi:hypothetical protein